MDNKEKVKKSEKNYSKSIKKKESELKTQKNVKKSNGIINNNEIKKDSSKNTLDKVKKQKKIKKEEINEINQNKKKDKNYFTIKEVLGIIIITIIVSFLFGYSINKNEKVYELSHYEKELINNYQYILNNYYKEIEPRNLVSFAIKGMIENLGDNYSEYISSEQLVDFNMSINGSFQGIGVQITYNENNNTIISYVYPNSPAFESGLQKDDIIISIANINVETKTVEEVQQIVSEQQDKDFEMVYRRNGKEYTTKLKRGNVEINSVTKKIYEDNNVKIGYLKLDSFASNSYEQFESRLNELETENIDSLIIDLRDNTGGQLFCVEKIVSLFIKNGDVIYQMKEKDKITKYYSSGESIRNYKVVILVNEFSASASELMAGTLKESYGATIIGKKTYGKGTAQEVIALENEEIYKFTTKEWLTSKGNSIDGVGVQPDVVIEQPEEYYNNPIEENDKQLNEAIKFLSK